MTLVFNAIKDGEEGWRVAVKMVLTTSFSSVTSTKLRISPQDFLIFSFDPFATLV